jgi:heme-degrading monooxygenase HmoA
MPYVLVRSKIEDYAKWKSVFDEHGATRKASGSKGGYVFRNADDPNELMVLLEWDDLAKAHQFAQSDDLRERMQRAGVTDRPDIYFLDEASRPSE